MTTKSKLISTGMQLALSDTAQTLMRGRYELQRRFRKSAHVVTTYIRPDDPYSLLLLRRIRDLVDAYDVTIDLKVVVGGSSPEYFPAAAELADYARRDVALLASMLGEPFADKPSMQFLYGVAAMSAITAEGEDFDTALESLVDLTEAFWAGDESRLAEAVAPLNPIRLEEARQIAEHNRTRLLEAGHYNSAMLNYGGEWYWGIDRLHYLTERLDRLGLRRSARSDAGKRLRSIITVLNPPLPPEVRKEGSGTLEFYHSFRSPYSYLALERTFRLADCFGLDLDIRPVLPMVLRGLPVPRSKRMYIITDVNREAKRYGVPFGRIADPLNAAEACIALFIEAKEKQHDREFLLNVGRAAWAEGIDLTDSGALATVAARSGLGREQVSAALGSDAARDYAAANRDRLHGAGLWGVPSFRTGGLDLWGQDRLGVLTHHLMQ